MWAALSWIGKVFWGAAKWAVTVLWKPILITVGTYFVAGYLIKEEPFVGAKVLGYLVSGLGYLAASWLSIKSLKAIAARQLLLRLPTKRLWGFALMPAGPLSSLFSELSGGWIR